MKQTSLFVSAVYILRTGVFKLHLVFTSRRFCEYGLLRMTPDQNPENFSCGSSLPLLMMLITVSIIWT